MKKYDVEWSKKLSRRGDPRYVVVDAETREVLDNAQGYGYRSKQKAYAAYAYKNRTPAEEQKRKEKKKIVLEWCKTHRDVVAALEDDQLRIAMGKYGPEDKFNAKWVREALKSYGFKDLPFTPSEFLRYWQSRKEK